MVEENEQEATEDEEALLEPPEPEPESVPQGIAEPIAADPVPATAVVTEEAPGLPVDIVEGLAGQVEQVISVLKSRAPGQLKLQNAAGKLAEALTWLQDDLRTQPK